jgi:hypothetical protein
VARVVAGALGLDAGTVYELRVNLRP